MHLVSLLCNTECGAQKPILEPSYFADYARVASTETADLFHKRSKEDGTLLFAAHCEEFDKMSPDRFAEVQEWVDTSQLVFDLGSLVDKNSAMKRALSAILVASNLRSAQNAKRAPFAGAQAMTPAKSQGFTDVWTATSRLSATQSIGTDFR